MVVDFGAALPRLKESSAYEIVLTPGRNATPPRPRRCCRAAGTRRRTPRTPGGPTSGTAGGSPSDVSKFYTSGGFDVGGLRTGATRPSTSRWTCRARQVRPRVFANSLNTYEDLVEEQGPTNVFLRVDGGAEQELHLPLGYKWVVWDHTDTKVKLTAGRTPFSSPRTASTAVPPRGTLVDRRC